MGCSLLPGLVGDPGNGIQQLHGVRVPRTAEDGMDVAVLDDLARVHDHDAVRHLRDHSQVVRDDHDRGAQVPLQPAHQLQDLRLDRDIQRRCRLVRDQEAGVAGEGHGDHDALPHPAGELVGMLADALGRVGDPHQVQHLDGLPHRLFLVQLLVKDDGFRDLVADRMDGVQRGHRLLEDHGDPVAPDVVDLAAALLPEVRSLEQDLSRLYLPRRIDELHDRQGRDALPAAGFPHHPEGLVPADEEIDAIHGLDRAGLGVKVRLQSPDLEQGLGSHLVSL